MVIQTVSDGVKLVDVDPNKAICTVIVVHEHARNFNTIANTHKCTCET